MKLKEDTDEKIKRSKAAIEDIKFYLDKEKEKLEDEDLESDVKDEINLKIKEFQVELQKEQMYLKDLEKQKETEMKESSLNSVKVEKIIRRTLEKEYKILDFEIEEIDRLAKDVFQVNGQGVDKQGYLVLVNCDVVNNDGIYEVDVVDVIQLD